jgi:hypothetical protein
VNNGVKNFNDVAPADGLAPVGNRGCVHNVKPGEAITLRIADGTSVRVKNLGHQGTWTRLHLSAPPTIKFEWSQGDDHGPEPAA